MLQGGGEGGGEGFFFLKKRGRRVGGLGREGREKMRDRERGREIPGNAHSDDRSESGI